MLIMGGNRHAALPDLLVEHDPEKALPRPDRGRVPVFGKGLPPAKADALAKT
jgi:hypothetical protein